MDNPINLIYKLFGYEYKIPILEDEDIYREGNYSFFKYLKSISKPNNQICNKFINKEEIKYKCFDCEINSNSLICSDCFKIDIHKGHKIKCIKNKNYYSFCNCGDSNMIKKEGFCIKHKGLLKDEKSLINYIKSSINIELTTLNSILNIIFLLFINEIYQFENYEIIEEKKNKEIELFNMIRSFYVFCSKLYENNFGFLNLILLKCIENFPFETNHKCYKYNEEKKLINIIKENKFEKHICTCPFFQILINILSYDFFEKFNNYINLVKFFSLFINNYKIKLITGITFFHSFEKLYLNNNFVIFRKMIDILITDDLLYIISDEKNFSFFETFLQECYNIIQENIDLQKYDIIKEIISNLFIILRNLLRNELIDRLSSNLKFFKYIIKIISLFNNLNIYENKIQMNEFKRNNIYLLDCENYCLKIIILLSLIIDFYKEENIKFIFELLFKKLNIYKKKKDKFFTLYNILIRTYTILLNRFCFYYSVENNYDLFDSFKYYQNLFPKYKELNEFLFNKLIIEFEYFFLPQKYLFLNNFKKGIKNYFKYYFNSSISILCDITLMKYLFSLSEMKDKLNILKILNYSKLIL